MLLLQPTNGPGNRQKVIYSIDMLENILVNIQGILVFIIFLGILISVHEWGHFITAKKLGVKVEEFALGFGPKLFSWVYDGTEFLLCLIPLGGYVKMAGD